MMTNLLVLVRLSENDKRILIAICLVLILLFVLVGYIVVIVKRIMAWQGKAVDNLMYDLVKAKIVTTPRKFRKIAHKKSNIYFFKKSFIPFLLIILPTIGILIYASITEMPSLRILFSKDTGFGSLFYVLDWKNMPTANIFGIKIPSDFPPPSNVPHLVNTWDAWISYITFPIIIVGSLWYLLNVQAYIARFIRIQKKSKSVFQKSLDKLEGTLDN